MEIEKGVAIHLDNNLSQYQGCILFKIFKVARGMERMLIGGDTALLTEVLV